MWCLNVKIIYAHESWLTVQFSDRSIVFAELQTIPEAPHCCSRWLSMQAVGLWGKNSTRPNWNWWFPTRYVYSPHHKSWLILCFFLSLTNIFILHIAERAQARLETKTEVTAADSSRAKTTKYQNISIIVVIIIIIINVMPNLSYFSRRGRFRVNGSFRTPLWNY